MSTYTQTQTMMSENSLEYVTRLNRASYNDQPRAVNPSANEWVLKAKDAISSAESWLEVTLTKKVRHDLLGFAGPTLLCVTFIEDALRIPLRWSEQFNYMTTHRGFWAWFATLALVAAFAIQIAGAVLVLRPKRYEPSRVRLGSYLLLGYTAVQPFLYGEYGFDFCSRAATLAGGLVLLSSGAKERAGEKYDLMSMVSMGEMDSSSTDKLQLCGRLLLTCLFLFQAVHGEQGGLHSVLTSPGVLNVLCFAALVSLCTMVCVGFKTEWSSMLLTLLLAAWAFFIHPFWAFEPHAADFHRYYFFQTLSLTGGMLLLTLHGPGGHSLDGSKKKM